MSGFKTHEEVIGEIVADMRTKPQISREVLWTAAFPDPHLRNFIDFTHGYRQDLGTIVGELGITTAPCPIVVREGSPVSVSFTMKSGILYVTATVDRK